MQQLFPKSEGGTLRRSFAHPDDFHGPGGGANGPGGPPGKFESKVDIA